MNEIFKLQDQWGNYISMWSIVGYYFEEGDFIRRTFFTNSICNYIPAKKYLRINLVVIQSEVRNFQHLE